MWERLKKWFSGLFSKREHVLSNVEQSSPAPDPPPPPVKNPFTGWAGWTIQEVIMRLGRGLSDEEIAQAKAAGVIVKETAVVEGVDRSGFDLSDESPRVNVLEPDRDYPFTYTVRPGASQAKLYVYGASGTRVTHVNGEEAPLFGTWEKAIPPVSGSFSVRVRSIGKDIAVRLWTA